MTKWFRNSIGLPEDKLHKFPALRVENFLPLIFLGRVKSNYSSPLRGAVPPQAGLRDMSVKLQLPDINYFTIFADQNHIIEE